MGIITAVIAVTAAVGAYVVSEKGRKEASVANEAAATENRKARSEEKAVNAQKAASERRQQVREERVASGRLLQSSENSGVFGSAGMMGAQSGLATQLGANIGTNLGMLQASNNISSYNQNAADFQAQAQQALSNAASKAGMFQLVGSVASTASSYAASTKKAPTPPPKQ
jgi:hypothetical protein